MPADTINCPFTDHIPSKICAVDFCVDVVPSHVSISPAELLFATIYNKLPCAAKPFISYPLVKPWDTLEKFSPPSVDL